jgi:hypothetical protein
MACRRHFMTSFAQTSPDRRNGGSVGHFSFLGNLLVAVAFGEEQKTIALFRIQKRQGSAKRGMPFARN